MFTENFSGTVSLTSKPQLTYRNKVMSLEDQNDIKLIHGLKVNLKRLSLEDIKEIQMKVSIRYFKIICIVI